jgi:hypothetical protein
VRCAMERQLLADQSAQVERKLDTADRVLGVATLLTRNPLILAGGLAGLVVAGPWRLIRWATQGIVIVKIILRLRSWLQ